MRTVTYVGIDVSKATIDVCVLKTNYKNSTFLKLPNSPEGFEILVDHLAKAFPDHEYRFGFEPTGNYMVALQRFLHGNSFDFVMVNAATVHHFAKSKNMKTKTDKHDGYLIALYVSTLPDTAFVGAFDGVRNELKRFGTYLSFIVKLEGQVKGMRESLKHSDTGTDSLAVDVEDLLAYFTSKKKRDSVSG